MPRSSVSSSSSTCTTASSLSALAVTRTLSPSMPLARKAMVARPLRSSASRRSPQSSPRRASDVPQVRRVRLRMTEETPARRFRSGMTVPSSMMRIS